MAIVWRLSYSTSIVELSSVYLSVCLSSVCDWQKCIVTRWLKGKGQYICIAPYCRQLTSKAPRYGNTLSRDLTVLPAHPRVYPGTEWTIPAFAFPAEAGTYLPTPKGWKAETDRLTDTLTQRHSTETKFSSHRATKIIPCDVPGQLSLAIPPRVSAMNISVLANGWRWSAAVVWRQLINRYGLCSVTNACHVWVL